MSAGFADEDRAVLDDLFARVASRFVRREPRMRAQLFVRGILSGLERKNSWTLAGYAGDSDPNGMQRLLTSAHWNVDGVRDDLRGWVLERLAGPGYGVLIPIVAGLAEKGDSSVGVHPPYSDTPRGPGNVPGGGVLAYPA